MLEYLRLPCRKTRLERRRGEDAPSLSHGRSAAKAPDSDWLSSLQSLLATVVIAVFVITFVVQAFQIPSESMENTLLIGDYLLVDKTRYGGSWLLEPDHALPSRAARGHHRVSLSGQPQPALCEARGGRARRPRAAASIGKSM